MRPFVCSLSLILIVLVTNISAGNTQSRLSEGINLLQKEIMSLTKKTKPPGDQSFIDEVTCKGFWDDEAKNPPSGIAASLPQNKPQETLDALYYLQKAAEESFFWIDHAWKLVDEIKRHDTSEISRAERIKIVGKTSLSAAAVNTASQRGKNDLVVIPTGGSESASQKKSHNHALRIGIRGLLKLFFGEDNLKTSRKTPSALRKLKLISAYRGLSSKTAENPNRPHFAKLYCGDRHLKYKTNVDVEVEPPRTPKKDPTIWYVYDLAVGNLITYSTSPETSPICSEPKSGTFAYTRPMWNIEDPQNFSPQMAVDVIYFCAESFHFKKGSPKHALMFRRKYREIKEKQWLSEIVKEMNTSGYTDNIEGYLSLHSTIIHETFHMRRWDTLENIPANSFPDVTTDDVMNPQRGRDCYGWRECVHLAQTRRSVADSSNNAETFAYFVVATAMLKHASELDTKPTIRGFADNGKLVKFDYESVKLEERNDVRLMELFEEERTKAGTVVMNPQQNQNTRPLPGLGGNNGNLKTNEAKAVNEPSAIKKTSTSQTMAGSAQNPPVSRANIKTSVNTNMDRGRRARIRF